MAELKCTNMEEDYGRICRWVRDEGEPARPRGLETREVLNASLEFADPTRMLPIHTGRGISTQIAAIETLQLVGGFCDPELVMRASGGSFAPYMDQGNFHGGYGLRTRMQFGPVLERLVRDPASRQAVAVLWNPLHDLFVEDAHDYPCTLAMQFMVRRDALDLHVHMRSNDVWRGLAYDAFVFTQLQLQAALVLGLPAGRYFHHAASLHLYESDAEQVDGVSPRAAMDGDYEKAPWRFPFDEAWADDGRWTSWADRQRLARRLAYHEQTEATNAAADWYIAVMGGVRP